MLILITVVVVTFLFYFMYVIQGVEITDAQLKRSAKSRTSEAFAAARTVSEGSSGMGCSFLSESYMWTAPEISFGFVWGSPSVKGCLA